MKILHINSYFSTSGLFSQLYNRQINEGHNLSVYVPIADNFANDRLSVSGDYTTVVRPFKGYDRFIFHLKHYKILNDLKQRYHHHHFDIIHAHSLFSNGWLAYHFAKSKNIPYIVAVRNADIRTFFRYMPWLRPIGIKILKNAQKIIFISRNSYQEVLHKYIPMNFQDDFIQKTIILPNGIDQYWHDHTVYQPRQLSDKTLNIVSTGKVMGLKRFPQLAQMVKAYQDQIGPAHLHIIGPDWNTHIVNKLTRMSQVTYHGPMKKEELKAFYRNMDVFALLSSPETFGLVYVEAMSQGLPVIYTRGEGFDSFFENGSVGMSVDKTDVQGFIDALIYIQKNYDNIRKNLPEKIKYFNWDHIHREYLKLYQKILEEDTIEKS